MSVQINDLELLDAVRGFALVHPHPDVQKFSDSMQNWGNDWISIEPNYLPAADFLAEAIANTGQQTRSLVESFEQHKRRLHWEQSYKKADDVV
ncbi:MAG: hypothetical protein KJP11_06020, partial [Gammaproteobacteria bacterium]|nr:hypothetical protein [Gammaproteobacteria bacterium]